MNDLDKIMTLVSVMAFVNAAGFGFLWFYLAMVERNIVAAMGAKVK